MVWMKKTKDGAHRLTHHGKPIKIGTVLDVERAVVGRYKDAGFEKVKPGLSLLDIAPDAAKPLLGELARQEKKAKAKKGKE